MDPNYTAEICGVSLYTMCELCLVPGILSMEIRIKTPLRALITFCVGCWVFFKHIEHNTGWQPEWLFLILQLNGEILSKTSVLHSPTHAHFCLRLEDRIGFPQEEVRDVGISFQKCWIWENKRHAYGSRKYGKMDITGEINSAELLKCLKRKVRAYTEQETREEASWIQKQGT